jgi:hypothetical protein
LVGTEKALDAFTHMHQFSLQTLLALFGRIGRARCCQPSIQLLLYERGVFQQFDDLCPNDLIEQILPDHAAVVANRATQLAPAIRANAFVIVNLAGACLRR